MVQRRALWLSSLAAVLAVGSACYSYEPVETPAPGTPVRIQVPVNSPVVRPNQAPETMFFEGTLVSLGDTLLLATRSRREVGAFREILEFDTLRVAQSRVSLLEERLLSKPKTYAFTAVVTGGVVALGIAALNTLTGQKGGEPQPDDPRGALILNPIFSGLLKLIGR